MPPRAATCNVIITTLNTTAKGKARQGRKPHVQRGLPKSRTCTPRTRLHERDLLLSFRAGFARCLLLFLVEGLYIYIYPVSISYHAKCKLKLAHSRDGRTGANRGMHTHGHKATVVDVRKRDCRRTKNKIQSQSWSPNDLIACLFACLIVPCTLSTGETLRHQCCPFTA